MKKHGQILLAALLVTGAALLVWPANVQGKVRKTVNPNRNDGHAPEKVIQQVLNEARDRATASNPYVVTVKPGSYYIEHAIKVYSNTTLVLEDVRLYASGDSSMIKVGAANDTKKGYAYKNITIRGGILDMQHQNHTATKIAHAKNVVLKNVKMRNGCGHFTEVAGVNGLTIQGCVYRNQYIKGKKTYEAIQLDIMSSSHIAGYRDELKLATKNVKIKDCTFENLPRGVGSHTTVMGVPFQNISVVNCKFKKMKSAAIQAMDWTNARISGNLIDAPRGIAIYTYRDQGVYRTSGASWKKSRRAGIVIANNKILCRGKDKYAPYTSVGISLSGYKLDKKKKDKDSKMKIPKNNYCLVGVKLFQNYIKVKNKAVGIRVLDAKDVKIWKNKVTAATYGIHVGEQSKKVSATENRILKCKDIGIYYNGAASLSKIAGNKVADCTRGTIVSDTDCEQLEIKNNKES